MMRCLALIILLCAEAGCGQPHGPTPDLDRTGFTATPPEAASVGGYPVCVLPEGESEPICVRVKVSLASKPAVTMTFSDWRLDRPMYGPFLVYAYAAVVRWARDGVLEPGVVFESASEAEKIRGRKVLPGDGNLEVSFELLALRDGQSTTVLYCGRLVESGLAELATWAPVTHELWEAWLDEVEAETGLMSSFRQAGRAAEQRKSSAQPDSAPR